MKWFYYILCDITSSFLIYSAGRYLFRELCQTWHSVHHSLPPVRKCSNVTDPYELPDLWLPNCPGQNIFHYRIWVSESTRKSTGWERLKAASDWCVSSSGTERYWRRHWSVAQTSPCLYSSQRRTFWIFTVTQISQNIINCNNFS